MTLRSLRGWVLVVAIIPLLCLTLACFKRQTGTFLVPPVATCTTNCAIDCASVAGPVTVKIPANHNTAVDDVAVCKNQTVHWVDLAHKYFRAHFSSTTCFPHTDFTPTSAQGYTADSDRADPDGHSALICKYTVYVQGDTTPFDPHIIIMK